MYFYFFATVSFIRITILLLITSKVSSSFIIHPCFTRNSYKTYYRIHDRRRRYHTFVSSNNNRSGVKTDRNRNGNHSKDELLVRSRITLLVVILSFCSGISPATQIIAQTYKTRLPDCPIAHDVDTLLLWPSSILHNHNLPQKEQALVAFSIFTKPMAALTTTTTSINNIPWKQVIQVYITQCIMTSAICLSIVFLFYTLQQQQEEEE